MKTPICDFTNEYIKNDASRFHVPGHKGYGPLNAEQFDITEISGADDLFNAKGIIAKSEKNATKIFNSRQTFYSCEGSSLCIRAMLYLVKMHAKNSSNTILAARNVHKTFLFGCALLDITPHWIYNNDSDNYINCTITSEMLDESIKNIVEKPMAVYITAPNYLGQSPNITLLAQVCKKHDIPLIVDNAHGAYLKFINSKTYIHPLNCGADMCCDSAHKTLPVLTGGAYLHVAKNANAPYENHVKNAMSLFASTSPSYLILNSLDACNKQLFNGYIKQIKACVKQVKLLKNEIKKIGFNVLKSDPLRIVINASNTNFSGIQLARKLQAFCIEPEFYDDCNLVLMISANNSEKDFIKLIKSLKKLYKTYNMKFNSKEADFNTSNLHKKKVLQHVCANKTDLITDNKNSVIYNAVLTPRQALFAQSKNVPIESSIGKICAKPAVSCPPAVPLVMCGELITQHVYNLLKKYGITNIDIVVK